MTQSFNCTLSQPVAISATLDAPINLTCSLSSEQELNSSVNCGSEVMGACIQRGEKGPQGETGETGERGPSAVVISTTEPTDTDIKIWLNPNGTQGKTSELINDSGFITKDVSNLTNYTKTSDLATVATTGSYNDLTNKPTIPTKTSDLTNDSGYITGITSSDVTTALGYTPYNSTNPNGYQTASEVSATVSAYHDSTKYDASNPNGYISQAVDDSSTTSTTLGWSASKLNTTIGNIESALQALRGNI